MCACVSEDKLLPIESATSISKKISNLPEKITLIFYYSHIIIF